MAGLKFEAVKDRLNSDLAKERKEGKIMLSLFYVRCMKEIPELIQEIKRLKIPLNEKLILDTTARICASADEKIRSKEYEKTLSPVHIDENAESNELEGIFNYMENVTLNCRKGKEFFNCCCVEFEPLIKTLNELDFYGTKAYIKEFIKDITDCCAKAKTTEEKLTAQIIGAALLHYIQRFYNEYMKGVDI